MTAVGLDKPQIVARAVELIEQKGTAGISMRELAESLGVKTPSLYNHVTGMEELELDVARYSGEALGKALTEAVAGKRRDDAVAALADAYRKFGKEHPGMYDMVMALPRVAQSEFGEIVGTSMRPIAQTLREYKLSDEQTTHWQRTLRSIMHGFISQEKAGFFRHVSISADASYRVAVRCYVNGLHAAEQGKLDE